MSSRESVNEHVALPNGDVVNITFLVDVSGSMSAYENAFKRALAAVFAFYKTSKKVCITTVPFGPESSVACYYNRVTNRSVRMVEVWRTEEEVNANYHTDFGTYTTWISNISKAPITNILVIVTDGDFSDDGFPRSLQNLSNGGHFAQMSKVLIIFRPNTNDETMAYMEAQFRAFLTADPSVACRAPEVIKLTNVHDNTFKSAILPHIADANTIVYPKTWKKPINIAGIVVVNGDKPLSEVVASMDLKTLMKINDALIDVIKDNPASIAEDGSNWSVARKLLLLSPLKENHTAWFNEYKQTVTDKKIKDILNKMALDSHKDEGAVLKVLDALGKNNQLTGMCVWFSERSGITEIHIAEAIQRKKFSDLISRMIEGGAVIRKCEPDLKTMPLTYLDEHRSCVAVLTLIFLQWGSEYRLSKDMLTVVVFDICAFIISSPEEVKRELNDFFQMIIRVICHERWIVEQLGYDHSTGEFDFSTKPLLFTRANIKNIAFVLSTLKEKIFVSTYTDTDGLNLSAAKVEKLIDNFCKLDRYQDMVSVIRTQNNSFTVSRTYREPVEGGGTPFDLIIGDGIEIGFGQILLLSDNSYRNNTVKLNDPKINLPTIAVVAEVATREGRRRVSKTTMRACQLDDVSITGVGPNHLMVDSVGFTMRSNAFHKLGARCLLDGTTDRTGRITPDHQQIIIGINCFLLALQGPSKYGEINPKFFDTAVLQAEKFCDVNKCTYDDFCLGAKQKPKLRSAVVDYIRIVFCAGEEAKTVDNTYTMKVPSEVIMSLINLPQSVKVMLKSGANLNFAQALALLDEFSTQTELIDNFKVGKHDVLLTKDEIDHFRKTIVDAIKNNRKHEFKIAGKFFCMYCLDDGIPEYNGVHLKCCDNYCCKECVGPLLTRDYPNGSLLEKSMLGCMCGGALPHTDPQIKEFFAAHDNKCDVLVDKAVRKCFTCGKIFSQANPTCGSAEIIDATNRNCDDCDIEVVAAIAAGAAAAAGVTIWRCPHGGCDATASKGSGCDDMECYKCHKHSCAVCSCPFTDEQTDRIAHRIAWLCASHPSVGDEKCTEEYIDEYLRRHGYFD